MSGMQQRRPAAPAAPSQTLTSTEPSVGPQTGEAIRAPSTRILRLRGARASADRSVQWADDVVDNEGLGRKSSKVCCIYHKPKAVDESSDESSSSDSDASSGADSDFDADRKGKARACGHNHSRRGRKGDKHVNDGDKQKRRPSPNAYEKVPKAKPKETSHEAEGSKSRMG